MIFVHIAKNLSEANYEADQWLRNNPASRVVRRQCLVIYDGENEHHFLPMRAFERWCLGREYMTEDGTLCRNGHPVNIRFIGGMKNEKD